GFSNGQNARTAAATVQGLIDVFIEQNLSGDRRETGQAAQVLDEELRRRETALQEAEQRRVDFEQRYMGVLPGAGSIADRMSTEPGLAAEQTRLTHDYDVLKQQYDQLLANREQVRLRSDVQARTSPITVQVVEPPSVPTVPAAPNRPVFLTAILILGIGAGVA